jgi:hypothetical protein
MEVGESSANWNRSDGRFRLGARLRDDQGEESGSEFRLLGRWIWLVRSMLAAGSPGMAVGRWARSGCWAEGIGGNCMMKDPRSSRRMAWAIETGGSERRQQQHRLVSPKCLG